MATEQIHTYSTGWARARLVRCPAPARPCCGAAPVAASAAGRGTLAVVRALRALGPAACLVRPQPPAAVRHTNPAAFQFCQHIHVLSAA